MLSLNPERSAMIRKKPGGRTHVEDMTFTTGKLLVEPCGGGKERIPVTKLRTKIAATITPAITNLLERDIEDLAFRNYRFEHVSAPKIGLPIALDLVLD